MSTHAMRAMLPPNAEGRSEAVALVSSDDCWRLLAKANLGRIAVQTTDGLDIFPINYVVTGEEVFFRGLVLRSIRRPWLAIPISALGFAAIHLDPPHVVGVIPLGFYLAYVAYRADSTWVTIVAHAANNTIAVIAAKTGLPGSAADEPPPPLGWVIGGVFVALLVCVYVERATRRGSLASTSERASATSA